MTDTPIPKPSDLKVRTLSAIVMVVVAGTALWLGGFVFKVFVLAIAIGLLREWWGLISKFALGDVRQSIWMLAGIIYIGGATYTFASMRGKGPDQLVVALSFVLFVIATDVGAYFAGRTIGGPKIASSISPSKTWSGLVGGMIAAGLVGAGIGYWQIDSASERLMLILVSPLLAVAAQSGDFFQSWMKRKAGVKDSGALIPGHGGLFDRLDGLLMVLFLAWVGQW